MEPDGFKEFVAGQTGGLMQTARLLVGSWDEAEDLVQEALYRTLLHWKRVRTYERPEFYVRKVMLRERGLRWRRRRKELVGVLGEGPSTPDHQADHAQRDELWAALRTLPPRTRAVVVLRYWEDRSEADTAELLDISVGTVKSQASRGLAALRGRLADARIGQGETR